MKHFTERGAVFDDATEEGFDAVVLATGYRPAVAEIVDVPGALDENGNPRGFQSEGAAAGIYFVGYPNVATGLLREIAARPEPLRAPSHPIEAFRGRLAIIDDGTLRRPG